VPGHLGHLGQSRAAYRPQQGPAPTAPKCALRHRHLPPGGMHLAVGVIAGVRIPLNGEQRHSYRYPGQGKGDVGLVLCLIGFAAAYAFEMAPVTAKRKAATR